MKWTGSCGLIYFIFHQKDSFLSHITAIPLSTLVAESQVPLNSVQYTLKQISLTLDVTSCESPATINRKTIILALDAGSEAWKAHLGYYTSIGEQGSASRGHSACDFTRLVCGRIRDSPGEERLGLGLFHSYFWLAHWVNRMALNSWYSTNMSQRRCGCQCLSHTQTDTVSNSLWIYKEPKLQLAEVLNHHIKEPNPSLNILL